jgi:hypothetical protein
MTLKTKLALATVLFSTLASPVFAASQDEASVAGNSGRIVASQITVPNAYASAARPTWTRVMAGSRDFQLEGRSLGRGL